MAMAAEKVEKNLELSGFPAFGRQALGSMKLIAACGCFH
jgi:hypothetical protein